MCFEWPQNRGSSLRLPISGELRSHRCGTVGRVRGCYAHQKKLLLVSPSSLFKCLHLSDRRSLQPTSQDGTLCRIRHRKIQAQVVLEAGVFGTQFWVEIDRR